MMKGLFVAASGNRAVITVTNIDNRWLLDFGWEHCPPSPEDLKLAEEEANRMIEVITGATARVLDSKYFEGSQKEEWEKQGREFLGGGKG